MSTARALEYALTHARHRGALDAMLIADDFGMLVSRSHGAFDLEQVAAVAPIVARGRARATVRRRGESRGMSVRTLRIQGERLHVAAVGGALPSRRREIATAISAARRILG